MCSTQPHGPGLDPGLAGERSGSGDRPGIVEILIADLPRPAEPPFATPQFPATCGADMKPGFLFRTPLAAGDDKTGGRVGIIDIGSNSIRLVVSDGPTP